MSLSANVLDFFILEASEYIDRLDVLIGAAGPDGPDLEAVVRPARALRGSATMSRQTQMAELATALERTLHALRDGTLNWNAAVRGAVVATVDDLRYLLRRTRSWGAAEDQRVRTRLGELSALAPAAPPPTPTPTPTVPSGNAYLAGATAELAEALDRALVHPTDRTALTTALGRARTLRGVAAIKDLPPTTAVVDAVDRVGKSIELAPGAPNAQQLALLSAAAAVLRRVSGEIAARGRPADDAPDVLRFNAALAALEEENVEADRVVPIAQLFFADAGPHVVAAAPNPPTRPAERFRLEVVSQAEHLRRLVDEARVAPEVATAERLTRDLRAALRALRATAESFEEEQVVRFASAWSAQVSASHPAALTSLGAAAALLSNPATRRDELLRELDQLAPGRAPASPTPPNARPATTPTAIPAEAAAATAAVDDAAAPAPAAAGSVVANSAAPVREPLRTPTGKHLHEFLASGISTLERLHEQPLASPVHGPYDEIVPIEELLYRGRAALERAAALRDELRAADAPPSPDALDELFDLLDLALTD